MSGAAAAAACLSAAGSACAQSLAGTGWPSTVPCTAPDGFSTV